MDSETVTLSFDSDPSHPFDFNPKNSDESRYRGNCDVTRNINKQLIQTALPVDTQTGGGLAIDIGFLTDTFTVSFTTYRFDDYILLSTLIKVNDGLRSGVFTLGSQSYDVAVNSFTAKFEHGKGDFCQMNVGLIVVSPDFND